jgi:hypothetical protein
VPLFEDRAIAIHRTHQTIGAGANPRPSSFPSTFRPKSPFTLLCGFMLRVLGNLQANFPQQRLDV